MIKLLAVLNVVAWSGFWAFGYLALTSDVTDVGQMLTALVLAAVGGAIGVFAYMKLVRHSERTGYAKKWDRADLGAQLDDGETP